MQETEGGEVRWRDQVLGPEVETYQVAAPAVALVLLVAGEEQAGEGEGSGGWGLPHIAGQDQQVATKTRIRSWS